jgi:hypothetical protein
VNSSGAAGKGGGNATAAGTGGGNSDDGGGAGGEPPSNAEDAVRLDYCAAICATEAELPCSSTLEQCIQGFCGTAELLPPLCVGGFDAFLACLATQPAEGFYCEDGMPYVKEETCAGEQEAFISSCSGG